MFGNCSYNKTPGDAMGKTVVQVFLTRIRKLSGMEGLGFMEISDHARSSFEHSYNTGLYVLGRGSGLIQRGSAVHGVSSKMCIGPINSVSYKLEGLGYYGNFIPGCPLSTVEAS